MNLEEAKVLALAIYVSGGEMVLGDAVGKLNTAGLDVIRKVLPPLARPARPLDPFDPEWQECPVLVGESDTDRIICIFNLSDIECRRDIQLDSLDEQTVGRDFWTDEKERVERRMALKLQPRSVKAIRIPR